MRRREFIAGLGATAVWPLAAHAQQGERTRRVGMLMAFVKDDPRSLEELVAFRQRLAELGWVEGRNIDIEFRWPGGDIDAVETLANELVTWKPDVLLARSTPATLALKKATRTIPIVFVNAASPVEQGFVQSLARPGGNITGFTNFESSVGGKMLQLLKEIDPRIARVAVIYNPLTAPFAGFYLRSMEPAASVLSVQTVTMLVQSEGDIEAAMAAFGRQPGGGVVAIPDSFTIQHRRLIIALAARNSLPTIYGYPSSMSMDGLMAYYVDTRELMHRAAGYIDRILRGEKPGELAVQQPVRFNLVINRKVANSLGLTISPQLSIFADEVIE
jgi:putative tryptophan/tyrosine transport system substrate-binding protein